MTRTLDYDVLIIGSGAGGGTVAARLSKLCEQGARIAVVEAGAWFTRENFNMREPDMLRLFVDRGAKPSKNFEIAVSAGQCVGGSTSVYTGVTFRTPLGLFDEWSRDFGLPELSDANIHARFAAIEQAIDAHVPGRDYENENNRLFRAGCEQLGWPVKQFAVNIKNCERCGFCNLGCPFGAKRGTLEVQLPAAIARGVDLIPNCRIERVIDHNGRVGAEGVIGETPTGTLPGKHAAGPVRFNAKTVVISAGTLSSSALLLRSQLPGLSRACGKYVTLHPALTSFALMPEPVRGFDGFPKLYYTDKFSESHHYYLETAFYFPFVTAKSLPSFGLPLKHFMRDYAKLACALTLVHDEAEEHNAIRLDKHGGTVLDYRLSAQSRDAIVHAQKSAGQVYFAAGAKSYVSLLNKRFAVERASELEDGIAHSELKSGKVVISSAHPMGGCRMGRDTSSSVTDGFGRVHGHPNLVVADASLFPTSSKVNPYLTIMALTDHVAQHVEARLG